MAQLIKRPARPGYYARFQFNGKEIVRATGETSKPKAQEFLERLMAETKQQDTVEDAGQRLLTLLSKLPVEKQAEAVEDVVVVGRG